MLTSQFRRPAPFTATSAPPSRRPLAVRASIAAAPVSVPCKAVDGSEKGSQQVALKVAKDDSANGLVHRYLVLVQQNARRGTASTKTRMEVRGGGKKPYDQKGTGNARRGSNRSPLFPGGGVVFGPKPRDWSIKMNKKERRLALATAFQSAAEDMIVVDSLEKEVSDKKTKSLLKLLADVGADAAAQKVLLILKEPLAQIDLAGRNLKYLAINRADAISIFDLLDASKIVIESAALEFVQSFYGAAAAAGDDAAASAEEPAPAAA